MYVETLFEECAYWQPLPCHPLAVPFLQLTGFVFMIVFLVARWSWEYFHKHLFWFFPRAFCIYSQLEQHNIVLFLLQFSHFMCKWWFILLMINFFHFSKILHSSIILFKVWNTIILHSLPESLFFGLSVNILFHPSTVFFYFAKLILMLILAT